MAYSEVMGTGFRGKPLREVSPDLSRQWHPIRNGESTPDNTSSGANRKAWWICDEGHEWDAVISSRVRLKLGCPICSGRRLLSGFNDLATKNPSLASEWHPTKNGDLLPSSVPPSGPQKVWWLGRCGHEWQTTVNSRAGGAGCPFCANQKVLAGFNDLGTRQPHLISEWHPHKNSPVDPTQVIAGSNKKYWWMCKEGHEWEATPGHRKKAGCGVCAGQILLAGFNDLATLYPKVASRWHPSKNGDLTPSNFSPSSKKKHWWMCKEGHEWESLAYPMTRSRGEGCPTCAGQKVLAGFNDILTTDPEVSKEWHPELNLPLLPTQVPRGTRRKVWWLCEEGHEWQAIVANRTVSGNKCPYCQHQWLLVGENDLATLAPELAAEWHPTKNRQKTPSDVFATSGKKYWWLGKCGHEWEAKVSNRRSLGLGCPFCSNQKVLPGFNDLATVNPALAAEWHPIKNGQLTPAEIAPNGVNKPWWLGPCGHEWKADVGSRNSGASCPFCSNQKVLPGFNDMQTTHPNLAAEWHPTKNNGLKPSQVVAGSNKKFWWLGKCGHEWASVSSSRMVSTGDGCPICANLLLLEGFNDLATVGPHLIPELHPSRNKGLNPQKIIGFSAIKRWWLCNEGHAWLASSGSRLRGTGCPKCAKSGFDQTSDGYLYLLKKENIGLQQFGISNSPKERLARHKKNGWEVLDVVGPADGLWTLQTETALKRFFRVSGLLLPKDYPDKFDGYSESWDSTSMTFSSVSKMLEALRQFEDADGHARPRDEA